MKARFNVRRLVGKMKKPAVKLDLFDIRERGKKGGHVCGTVEGGAEDIVKFIEGFAGMTVSSKKPKNG